MFGTVTQEARRVMGIEVLAMHCALRLLPSLEQDPQGHIPAQVYYPCHLQDQQQPVGFVQLLVPLLKPGRKHL